MVGVRRPPSSVHSGCKSDYSDERYHQFNIKSKHAVSTLYHKRWIWVFGLTINFRMGDGYLFVGF